MTTYHHFTFTTQLQEGHQEAAQTLWLAVAEHWWYLEPETTQEGPLEFSFWALGRDQWFCHLRAVRLATDAVYAAGGRLADVPIPAVVKRPPHTNRGFLVTG